MNKTRYAPGGDIYQDIATKFGRPVADAAYAASLKDDYGKALRDVLTNAAQTQRSGSYTPEQDASLLSNLGKNLSDPLAAPLDALDNQLGKAVWNVVRNPFVLAIVAGFVVFYLWPKMKKFLP